MPWADEHRAGLVFVAFGKVVRRLRGPPGPDGRRRRRHPDALFKISRPVSGGYFWCPPLEKGRLDLRALGL
jgi:putative iron-dependent peroxidase